MYLETKGIRVRESFNNGWLFRKDDEKHFRNVKLPHDWSLDYPYDENAISCGSGGYVETGIGWYEKNFDISSEGVGNGRVCIRFDGAYMNTSVWINQHYLGTHVYGYTPFFYDITDYVSYDKTNVISVKIDNSHQPNSRWYSGSGITRNVWIERVNNLHISEYGVWIMPIKVNEKMSDILIETTFEDNGYKDIEKDIIEIETQIVTQEGATCLRVRNTRKDRMLKVCQEVRMENPVLWDIDNPYLYTAVTRLYVSGNLVDEVATKFGIRSAVFDKDRGFILNQRQVKLNGVCLHHDGGCMGAAVPKAIWERRLVKLKDMGANAIRTAHNPPDSDLLDLCDSMGFLVMDEAFDEWRYVKGKELGSNTHESRGYSDWFDECHEDDLRTMVLRDRNHASVILWSIGNEVPDQTDEFGYLTVRKLKNICKSLDPSRFVTQANDQIAAEPKAAHDDFLNELDVVGYNYAGRWRTRAETYYGTDKLEHPEWYIIGTENGSIGGVRGKYLMEMDECGGWWKRPYYSAPVEVGRLLRYTMTHDFVAGDFMWTGIDYLGEAHWPHRSSSAGVLDTCGFEKDGYYFYKSIWNRKIPMVHIMPHWNIDVEKGRIIPVIGFTNCEYAELTLNGKSYGKKAMSYPAYGMTMEYGHFDKTPIATNTNDLFLSWDVPYEPGTIEIIGYNGGKEVACETVHTAKNPMAIKIECYNYDIKTDGFDVGQLEIMVVDEDGNLCYQSDIEIEIEVDDCAKVIGIDNGNPASHESMRANHIHAFSGKAFCVVEPIAGKGSCKVTARAFGLKKGNITLNFS